MTNHDELCEKDKYGLPDCPICGKRVAIICPDDLIKLQEQAKLSGSCEGSEKFLEELAEMIDFNDQEQSLMNIAMTLRFRFEQNAQMTGGKK